MENLAPNTCYEINSGRNAQYWKTLIQYGDDKQLAKDNVDNTNKGTEISSIAKINGKYYCYPANGGSRIEIKDGYQITCYYKLIFTNTTGYGYISGADWGYANYNAEHGQYYVDYQLKLIKADNTVDNLNSNKQWYHANGIVTTINGIGCTPTDKYVIYKLEVIDKTYNSTYKYGGDTGKAIPDPLTLTRGSCYEVIYYLKLADEYTLTYVWTDAPDNINLPASVNKESGESVNVDTQYKKDDTRVDSKDVTWKFSGWYIDSTFTTPAGDTILMDSNKTLYGYWTEVKEPEEYTVTYAYVSDSVNPTTPILPAKQTFEKNALVEIDTTNSGSVEENGYVYSFSGWFTDEALTNKAVAFNITQDTTLYGKWTKTQATGTIKIIKTVTGLPTDKLPDSFKFEIKQGDEVEATVTATKQTDNTYSAAIATLPYGKYTVSEITQGVSVDDYNIDIIIFGGNVTLSADEPSATVDVINEYTQSPKDLVIRKTVTGTGADKDKEFTFTVTLNNEKCVGVDYPSITDDQSNIEFQGNGTIEFTLKDTQAFTIKYVPAGTTYTITESDNEGYTPTAKVNGEPVDVNENTVNGEIAAGIDTEVEFTNTKIGAATATIEATKKLDGKNATGSDFKFELYQIDGDGNEVPIETVNNNNAAINFTPIQFNKEGTYTYYIREVTKNSTYVVCDGTVYAAEVTVKPSGNSYTSEVKYYFVQGNEKLPTDEAVFRNESVGVLEISKKVAGNAASKDKEFTFIVTLLEALPRAAANSNITAIDYTAKDKAYYSDLRAAAENGRVAIKISLKGGETFTINGLPDGIRYTVQELDNNGYTVSAKVADEDVTLTDNTTPVKSIVIGKTTEVAFKNTKNYVYPPNPPIMDEITVEITGNSDSVVYDGTEHSVKGYTVKISDPRYTEADFTFTGKAEASGVNAGTYEMGLKAEQFKNTNARFTNVKFVIKADGVLTITPKDLTITAGSKTEYGPTPVTCDEWTVSGLVAGDKVESVKITGIQSVPGSSPNVPSDAVIKNAKGEDVTKNYAIKYVNGTLTMLEVLNKEDHFNYIIGTPEGLSLPTANVTRAEVATIFFRLMTDDARAKFDSLDNNFSDVAKGKWYNRAISTLAKAGIIKGDPAGTYRPGDPITRAEMAAIIARFGDFKEGGKTFNDISGHWAQKFIELAASNGWINGNPDGTFKPNNYITRAETVAMINRVLDRQTKDVSDLLPVSQMTNWSDNMDTAKWYYRDMQEATNNHKAERVGDSIYEKWTEKLPDIDWASYQI